MFAFVLRRAILTWFVLELERVALKIKPWNLAIEIRILKKYVLQVRYVRRPQMRNDFKLCSLAISLCWCIYISLVFSHVKFKQKNSHLFPICCHCLVVHFGCKLFVMVHIIWHKQSRKCSDRSMLSASYCYYI